jgi:predicted AlkP superfamily phosphohydrolase/phosphomutase
MRQGQSAAPLLFIGLDGGNWRTLQPLLDSGRLPILKGLIDQGVSGIVEAQWPPYWSGPTWAAILTGHPREATGVHEDLSIVAPGLPVFDLPLEWRPALNPVFVFEYWLLRAGLIDAVPTPRQVVKRELVWKRLTDVGIRTAVVRFPFTYPATGQASVVVSNRVVRDLWDYLAVRRGDMDQLAWPPERRAQLLAEYEPSADVDRSLFATILGRDDWPHPVDAVIDPVVVLRRMLDESQRTFNVAEKILSDDPTLDLMMVHIVAHDSIGHAFWQYRFPEDFEFPPSAADVAALGPVIDRYLEFFDRRIGDLISRFPTNPNVIVVSDHGHEAARIRTPWKGWHSDEGVFIAGGPNVAHAQSVLKVSYYDIAPTMFLLLNVAQPSDLSGTARVSLRQPE